MKQLILIYFSKFSEKNAEKWNLRELHTKIKLFEKKKNLKSV